VSIIEKAASKLDAKTHPAVRQATLDEGASPAVQAAAAQLEARTADAVPAGPRHAEIPPQAEPFPPRVTAHPVDSDKPVRQIDLEKLRSLGMVTPEGGRTQVAEEFRAIKRPLLTAAFGRGQQRIANGNLIMVTSALPGEGKTFTAINLALSIAMEMDHTVLLVDADVARPSVLDRLGLQADVGLLDLLHNEKIAVPDALMRTNVDRLSILSAGSSHRHSTELLASHAMSRLLNDLATRYPERIIIFDSPPLLLTTESRVLAEQMGQIVVVVEAETTTQHAVKNALRQVEKHKHVSLVYNKSTAFLGGEKYGHYYN
jgi:protein-tyrosine kinase